MNKRARRSKEGRSPFPGPEATRPEEIPQDPAPPTTGADRSRAMVLPVLMLLSLLAVWFGPSPDVSDPWVRAASRFGAPGETDAEKRATFSKAAGELTQLSETYPKHARVHYLTAYALISIDDFDGAIRHAREAVRLGSGAIVNRVDVAAREILVAASVRKSESLVGRKDYDAALKVLMAAREDAPDNLPVAVSIGNALLLKNDPKAALPYLEQAANLDPGNAPIQLALAAIYRRDNQIPKAIASLEKAVSLNPKDPSAPRLLAQLKAAPAAAK